MDIARVVYDGQVVASVTAERVRLAAEVEALAVDDPLRRMVCAMAFYAAELVQRGQQRYSDAHARRYARAALLPREQLEGARHLAPREIAARFNLPLAEVLAGLDELDDPAGSVVEA